MEVGNLGWAQFYQIGQNLYLGEKYGRPVVFVSPIQRIWLGSGFAWQLPTVEISVIRELNWEYDYIVNS